ncbi:deoxyribonuclease [Microbacterium sp. MYb54]|nr:deoxyribonuclease [Microbacterium sp. MYb43]PQZ74713.1 deoxyribonuclease [Microbacterium sp. MYb40]PRB18801.1 deoxyribonuclease [Microbacterium sp. MYb54]PRB23661.1 deoxyribonuclease [Microbacterium sp. MYb50]PRB63331.1 deoxyribonuclease [Microbacterium sp. MYb24]PRB71874.1 deoxyribonuclease [Microbacterium sp. MYb32]
MLRSGVRLMRRRTGSAITAAAGLVAVAIVACANLAQDATVVERPTLAPAATAEAPGAAASESPAPAAPISTEAGQALAQLEQLTIAEPSSTTKYVRDYFGQRWADVDRNGCDTRNDILARDLTDLTFKPGTRDCVVLSGVLYDRYTEETVQFVRISQGYQPVQVDHVVSLAVVWSSGAEAWTPEEREMFANDPLNLQTTTANQQKNEFTPSRWMPASVTAACEYSARYVTVLDTYDLTITAADAAALRSTLTSCSA